MFHDFARNEIVQEFLDSDCDVLWFLDSDIAPPIHVMDLVALHVDKWKVAGAPYPLWMVAPGAETPSIVFSAYDGIVESEDGTVKGIKMTAVPKSNSAIAWVDGLATGCLFIKREVVEKIPQPWFEFKFDPKTKKLKEGEDLGFCLKVSKLGYKFFTDFGMVCQHYKRVELLEMNNYSIDHSNYKLMEYDKHIRSQMEDLKKYVEVLKQENKSLKESRVHVTGPRMSKGGLILPAGL
jgi:GT2 family glycosyltransferase